MLTIEELKQVNAIQVRYLQEHIDRMRKKKSEAIADAYWDAVIKDEL